MKKVFLAFGVVALLGATSCSVDTSGLEKGLKDAAKEAADEAGKTADEDTKCGDDKCDGHGEH